MKNLTEKQKRCQDCSYLITVGKKWTCSECFGQLIENIDYCPEDIEMNVSDTLDEMAKIKVDHSAKSEDKPKDSKPKTVKVSDEKISLFSEILSNLKNVYDEVEILKENKLISVKINGKTFKIDLIEQRAPKK